MAPANAATIDDFEARVLDTTRGPLPYRLFLPPSAGEGLPLVVFLHGSGERGTDNRRQVTGQPGFLAFVTKEAQAATPCVLVAPQLPPGQRWSERADAVLALVDALEAELTTGRVVLTGLSDGAEGSFELLARAPERFSAAVVLSGAFIDREERLRGALPPVWIIHAADDQVVPVEGSRRVAERLEALGATYVYTEYPTGGHLVWDRGYAEPGLVEWALAAGTGRPPVAPALVARGGSGAVGPDGSATVSTSIGILTRGRVVEAAYRGESTDWTAAAVASARWPRGEPYIRPVQQVAEDTTARVWVRVADDTGTRMGGSFEQPHPLLGGYASGCTCAGPAQRGAAGGLTLLGGLLALLVARLGSFAGAGRHRRRLPLTG
jgi:predicted esterase